MEPLDCEITIRQGETVGCRLEGSTAEHIRFLMQTDALTPGFSGSMLDEALVDAENGRDKLIEALSHSNPNRRVITSQELIADIWNGDRGLGPYPLLKELGRCERSGVYHFRYRDHIVHQLRVWVLGLYFIGRIGWLRDALINEVVEETGVSRTDAVKEALRRWKIAALWHDIGYVFEVQTADEPLEVVRKSIEDLNQMYRTPVSLMISEESGLRKYRERGITKAWHEFQPVERLKHLHEAKMNLCASLTELLLTDDKTDEIAALADMVELCVFR